MSAYIECRCDERLKAKAEGSTRLAYTGLRGGLEHLKTETRLIDEHCVCVERKNKCTEYISGIIKRELKRILIYECQCNERLKDKDEGSTRLTYTGLRGGLEHLKIETRLIDEKFVSVMGKCVIVKYSRTVDI